MEHLSLVKYLQKSQGLVSGPHLSWFPWPQEPASLCIRGPCTAHIQAPGSPLLPVACWHAAYQSEFVLTMCPALRQSSRYPTFIGFEENRAGSYPKVEFVLREEKGFCESKRALRPGSVHTTLMGLLLGCFFFFFLSCCSLKDYFFF